MTAASPRINAWLRGWHGFFGIASASEMQMMRTLDAHIRRRLRAIMLRHWKRKRTIARRLIALGVKRQSAWQQVYAGRKSWWALSHTHAVDQGLRNAYFAKRGLIFLVDLHRTALAAHRRPRPATTGAMGMTSRSQTGRRRGSQPAVPKSRIRTAYVRFCGSRGGQPPRLPERRQRAARVRPGASPPCRRSPGRAGRTRCRR